MECAYYRCRLADGTWNVPATLLAATLLATAFCCVRNSLRLRLILCFAFDFFAPSFFCQFLFFAFPQNGFSNVC